MSRTWIKNPLAIYTADGADTAGGIVIEGNQIAKLVREGAGTP